MSKGHEHRYGGPWTEVKLDAVVYYLECYTRALSRVPFDLWYIDAFAGSGSRTREVEVGGLFEGTVAQTITETIEGSARRALAVTPPFQHLTFIEQDADRCAALRELEAIYPGRGITVLPGEANVELRRLLSASPWADGKTSRARGVVFLDPYALQVEWATLVALAATGLCDVWYLFPLRDVVRQLALDLRGIGPKAAKLDLILGPEWRQLYSLPAEAGPKDLLGEADQTAKRNATKKQIEGWFKRRLAQEFAFVSEPLPLLTPAGAQNFSLFLGVSNKGQKAIDLATTFVKYVARHYGPASRRKSGR